MWEGPYMAKQAERLGSFHLIDHEGNASAHSWNKTNSVGSMFKCKVGLHKIISQVISA